MTKKIITAEPPNLSEFLNPIKMITNLSSHKELISQFIWYEIIGRYKGTYLGLLWSLINPLMTLAVYTLVFGIILKARFTVSEGSIQVPYALNLFCGIIVYNIFSVCISMAPQSIIRNRNYVKRVVFPLEILPFANLCSSFIHAGMSFLILIPGLLIYSPKISSQIYIFPLVLLPLCALTLGISWFLATLGVFIRDVGQAINVLLRLLFFISPVIYTINSIPYSFQSLSRLNLLTTILENARRTLLWDQSLEWGWWSLVTIISFMIMQLGYIWFMRNKRKFADYV
jgi:lipopolysaccharide transport system permease protein